MEFLERLDKDTEQERLWLQSKKTYYSRLEAFTPGNIVWKRTKPFTRMFKGMIRTGRWPSNGMAMTCTDANASSRMQTFRDEVSHADEQIEGNDESGKMIESSQTKRDKQESARALAELLNGKCSAFIVR